MSFNVTPYLHDIDKEIVQHRQEIAKHQVRIQQLEDMRVLMMQREEVRAHANGHPSPFGALTGAEIAVRESRQLMDQGALSKAAKTDTPLALTREEKAAKQKQRDYKIEYRRRKREERLALTGGLNTSGNRRGMNNPPTRTRTYSHPKKGSGLHNRYKNIIVGMLKTSKALLGIPAIIEKIGEGPMTGPKARQPLYQALYELRKEGVIASPHGPGSYQYNAVNPARPEDDRSATPSQ